MERSTGRFGIGVERTLIRGRVQRTLTFGKDSGPFGIGVTLACLQQAGKLPIRTSRLNITLRRGAIKSAVLLRKGGNIPKRSVPPKWSKSETPDLALPEGKDSKTRRRMASERQINSLPGLIDVKMIRQQMCLTFRLTHQCTTLTNKRRQ